MRDTGPNVDPRVRDYLARAAEHRNFIEWKDEFQAWEYPISHYTRDRSDTQEDLDRYVKMLPLWVPGLKVVTSKLNPPSRFCRKVEGVVYFTWSRQGMWERYKELYKELGVADERLKFMVCSGTYKRKQPSLPGMVHIEPQGTVSSFADRYMFASWTYHGVQMMAQSFCVRITQPNRGGLDALPHSNWRCEVSDDWWLVGSKGDSPEILELEIQGSCIEQKEKENLLYNLHNRDRDVG